MRIPPALLATLLLLTPALPAGAAPTGDAHHRSRGAERPAAQRQTHSRTGRTQQRPAGQSTGQSTGRSAGQPAARAPAAAAGAAAGAAAAGAAAGAAANEGAAATGLADPAAAPPAPVSLPASPPPAPAAPGAALAPVAVPADMAILPGGGYRIPFTGDTLRPGFSNAVGEIGRQLAATQGRVTVIAQASGPAVDISAARRLSLSRALAVREALIAGGLPSTRIDVRAMGRTAEVADRVDVLPPAARQAEDTEAAAAASRAAAAGMPAPGDAAAPPPGTPPAGSPAAAAPDAAHAAPAAGAPAREAAAPAPPGAAPR